MSDRTNAQWLADLDGLAADAAISDLRAILLRGLRHALAPRGVTEADLEDFTQDALLKALRERAAFRGEARFTTWAQKIAVRVALTELRRRRWRDVSLQDLLAEREGGDFSHAALTDRAPDPGQLAMRGMMMDRLMRLIAEELTERQRQAMLAVMLGGMPLEEVARRMDTNRNALYKLLYDGRQRLQKRMLREGLAPADMLAAFADR
jgi:RNA polymerase sigma-70 factor, ECF subfamily